MFEKYFNRPYETHDFPYFVPEKVGGSLTGTLLSRRAAFFV